MKIEVNKKYRARIQCHHFSDDSDEGFYINTEDEYIVGFVFEKNNYVFVSISKIDDGLISPDAKSITIEMFTNCFEEV